MRDHTLSRGGRPQEVIDRGRRDFLVRFVQGAGATLIPARLWASQFPAISRFAPSNDSSRGPGFYLRPRYRNERPLDATLLKVKPGLDRFPSEICAEQLSAILAGWSTSLVKSPQEAQEIAKALSPAFSGASLQPVQSRAVRSDVLLQVRQNQFSDKADRNRKAFLEDWQRTLRGFTKIDTAEFQITSMDVNEGDAASQKPRHIETRIRYEIAGIGTEFYREQRIGAWHLSWESSDSSAFLVSSWRALDEKQARSSAPVYSDISVAAFANVSSYSAQMLHGSDYWRTTIDGACGIDVYGHNGVSVADIDHDGFDDLYVCQPAGLPNRLYRNRGDGTFEDITDSSGLGILDNTACALFADFDNDGYQDVILVRTNGPLLFQNDGHGKFRPKPDAFQFAIPPQGAFTGAAVADYDRDGWLDVYFCLYMYYQGTGQYRYPSPYYDAENGPPNFLMRNNRDGTFRDVTAPSRLNQNNTRYSFCCGWNDYNRDGWPDLYVVNDFGRKNLYRNNGDGTFTDVAPQTGAEDIGAGMSVAWFDCNNDGADDLYVANMWTAAGLRISTQDIFKKDSSPEVRALDQKHAMGNTLLRHHGDQFEDVTQSAGVAMGRWAWSSDAFDFDHDGFADLYITNGMVSGPSTSDLNGFFWRQVVANSPDEAGAAHNYEQGWNAINELIRSDGTWSGYERNIFYANNRNGTFSNVSAAVGLDFAEDGRSFALADLDHDGRLEIVLKNRNGPQLRLLKNIARDLPPSIAFRLQATKGNRDAIGALVTVETDRGRQTRSLAAGSGFLSQHSKDIFFGLGDTKGPVRATIRWPSGLAQELHELPISHRVSVVEGSPPQRVEPFKTELPRSTPAARSAPGGEKLASTSETWLLSPVLAPDFSLPDPSGRMRELSANRGKLTLLNFWTSQSEECRATLNMLEKNSARWSQQGLQLMAVNVDEFATIPGQEQIQKENPDFLRDRRFSFPSLRGSDDVAAIYNILYGQLFDRHRDLSLPTSFLIDAEGNIVKVYQGPIDPKHIAQDVQHIPRSDRERLQCALPFPSLQHTLEFGRNYLSLGAQFFQRGYLDQAEASFQQALRDDPSSAEALYGIGSVFLNQNKNAAAREAFERSVKLPASYPDTLPDTWNNLGVLDAREGRVADSVECFQQALKISPHHLLSLNNLGNAYRSLKRWDDARKVLELAVQVAPEDPEANYSLGMVFAQANDTNQTYEYLQRALKAKPNYPEALNNLGVLYLVTHRRDDAVETFEQCIRVAPAFDQAYLNLARVYALEGARDQARSVLSGLLKQHPDHPQAKQMLEQLQ